MDIKDHIPQQREPESFLEKISRIANWSLHKYRTRNVYQYYWWFRGRKEFISELLESLSIPKDGISLEAGCGTGEDLECIRGINKVVAFDLNGEALVGIEGLCVQGSNCLLPFRGEGFDTLFSFDVIEHIPDDEAAVNEFYRVLKPGGLCVVSVPANPWMYSTHDRYLGHQRRYSRKQLQRLFVSVGFEPIILVYWNFFSFFPIVFLRLIRKVFFWVVQRQALSDLAKLPYGVNWILHRLLRVENHLILKKHFRLPFGVSVYGVFRKSSG